MRDTIEATTLATPTAIAAGKTCRSCLRPYALLTHLYYTKQVKPYETLQNWSEAVCGECYCRAAAVDGPYFPYQIVPTGCAFCGEAPTPDDPSWVGFTGKTTKYDYTTLALTHRTCAAAYAKHMGEAGVEVERRGIAFRASPLWAIPCRQCSLGGGYGMGGHRECGRCKTHCSCTVTCVSCNKAKPWTQARYWGKCSKCQLSACSKCICEECSRCSACEKRCNICKRTHQQGCNCTDEQFSAANFWRVPVGMDLVSAAARFYLLAYNSILHPEYDPEFREYADYLAGVFSRYADMAIGGEIRYGFSQGSSCSGWREDEDGNEYECDCGRYGNMENFNDGVGEAFRATFPGQSEPGRGHMWSFWYVLRDKYGLEILRDAHESFMHDDWDGSIGGHAWGQVADVLIRYYDGDMSAVSFVDTMWGICHNGGSIFTKIWHHTSRLKKVLDANLEEDYDYLRECLSGEDRKAIERIEAATAAQEQDGQPDDEQAEQGQLIHWA